MYIKRSLTALIAVFLLFLSTDASAQTKCLLETQKAYKSENSSSVYFVTESCTRRPIKSPDVYFSYFSSWNNVRISNQISQIPDDDLGFLPYGPRLEVYLGDLVKTIDDPKVYVLTYDNNNNRMWRPIQNEQSFQYHYYNSARIKDVVSEVIHAYPVSDRELLQNESPAHGTLIRYNDSPDIYYIGYFGTKPIVKHVYSMDEFEMKGFRLDNVITLPSSERSRSWHPPETLEEKDHQRISDVRMIIEALETYYSNHGKYPTYPFFQFALGSPEFACLNSEGFGLHGCQNAYMPTVPIDPKSNRSYRYTSFPNGERYEIQAQLSGSVTDVANLEGVFFADQDGIHTDSYFTRRWQ